LFDVTVVLLQPIIENLSVGMRTFMKPAEGNATNHSLCPRYEHAIQLLGKRWTGLILDTLLHGPKRFGEVITAVEGLSDRVLSERLRELEVEGIVERVVYPHIPVRVEYHLTDKGRNLQPVLEAIHQWAEQWITLPETEVSS